MGKSFGLISVIMPAYNASATISDAIESVLNQSYDNIELIIINDCSSDDTYKLANQFADKDSRVTVLNNTVNNGVSKTRFKGITIAKGEWIAFLDSDDIWENAKLEKEILLQIHTGARLIYTGSAFINSEGTRADWIMHVPETICFNELLKQNVLSNSSVLVEKKLLMDHIVLNDEIHEDFATWLRIMQDGEIAHGIDEPLLVYRISSNSKSGNKIKSMCMNWKTYRYIGLKRHIAVFYMFCYVNRGIRKYWNIIKR